MMAKECVRMGVFMSYVFIADKNLFLWGLAMFSDSTVSMVTEVYLLPIGIEKHRSCMCGHLKP